MKTKQNAERPGFLLYYETLEALSEYSDSETGVFVRAMGDFAKYGVVPEFDDRGLRGLWKVVQPVLIRDNAAYYERCQKNRYSGYISVIRRRYQKEYPEKGDPIEGRDYLSFEDWVSRIDEATVNDRQQTLTTVSQQNENQNKEKGLNEKEDSNKEKSLNEKETGSRKGDTGETRAIRSVQSVKEEWIAALDAHDRDTAIERSNELSRMGYVADPHTRGLRKRDSS